MGGARDAGELTVTSTARFLHVRQKIPGNVSRWRDSDMVERWVASAWLLTERHFHRIDGYEHLWALAAILGRETNKAKKEKIA
jgi:hypothetical protein